MQGLSHYADDSDSSPPNVMAGPSRVTQGRKPYTASPSKREKSPRISSNSETSALMGRSPPHRMKSSKRPRPPSPLPENLMHTSQWALEFSELSSEPVAVLEKRGPVGEFEGMNEEDVFRIITRPAELDGVDDWGIPPAVDPVDASDALKAKVTQFLRLKREREQHINTSLLSSSSFANPHIYAKLVEFVAIDERATAFPSGGWLTRRNIESDIPTYGPQAMLAQQNAMAEAVRKTQEPGKRREISFAPSRLHDDGRRSTKSSSGGTKEKDERRDPYRREGRNGGWAGPERRRERR